jgi:hypothetical protein
MIRVFSKRNSIVTFKNFQNFDDQMIISIQGASLFHNVQHAENNHYFAWG